MHKPPTRQQTRCAFSLTVRELRKRVGFAQEKLALEVGVDRGYMSGLERGKHTPTLETIFKLLPALNVSFVEFAEVFEYCLKKCRYPNERAGGRSAA